jgi:N-acetylglucosaminyldiphosphoundecaprenol N-acetyl-beta-D-mannosaminyltransferase
MTATDHRPELPEVEIDGLRLHAIDRRTCIGTVLDALAAGRGGWIATANLDHLRRLRADAAFRGAYAGASLRVADGMPIVWAARIQGTPLPERVAGSDLTVELAGAAAAAARSLFLLGGDPGMAEAAAAELQRRFPSLRIAGTLCPARGFEKDAAALGAVRSALVGAEPDIVYVALGSPKQEFLIRDLRDGLPRAWWIGVGISFSFVAGTVRRAPRWVQRIGCEWVHRLAQEPRRLAKRYLVHGVPFALRLFLGAIVGRLRGVRRRCG